MLEIPTNQRIVKLNQEILKDYDLDCSQDSYILDFGCGSGRHVFEYLQCGYSNTFGCDIKDYLEVCDPVNRARFKFGGEGSASRIPFPDDYFDFVFSTSTFEHVIEQGFAYREINRVLKPGGICLNNFPSKWRPIEPHIYVPFGGCTKSYYYFLFWALLGIRNTFQKGLSAVATAKANHRYAHTGIRYLSGKEIDVLLGKIFDRHRYVELSFIRNSQGRSRKIYWLVSRFPFILRFYRFAHTRMILVEKAPLRDGSTSRGSETFV